MTPSQAAEIAAIEIVQKLQHAAIDEVRSFASSKVVSMTDYQSRHEGLKILNRMWQRMYDKLQGPRIPITEAAALMKEAEDASPTDAPV